MVSNVEEKNERLKLAFHASKAGVWDWNIKKRIAIFDEKWTEITGYTLSELELTNVKTWNKLVHPDDIHKLDELLEKYNRHQPEYYEYETRIKHKNGEWICVQIRGKIIEWDNNKKPTRMVGIIIDVTEKKKAENALLESEARFRTTFKHAVDPIFIATLTEGNIPIVCDINLAVTKKLGYHKDDLLNKPIKLLHPNENKKNILKRAKAILTGAQLKVESELLRKDGIIIPVEMSAKMIKINDKPYIYIIERDISDQKKWEKEILKTQNKLKEEITSKDKFFTIISHDLKAPFSALLGTLQLLDENYNEIDNEEKKEIISVARRSAKNIYELLESILEWSRASRDLMNFSPSNILLKALANHIIEILEQTSKRKNISIINNLTVDSVVYADKKMVETIFRNLIVNGIKFTPKGGKIIIDSTKTNNKIKVSVTDNGVGIAEDDLKKLFSIDIHHTTVGTENESGTGVGLLLCKELIKKNGGDIWAESKLGKGSKFFFTLPQEKKRK